MQSTKRIGLLMVAVAAIALPGMLQPAFAQMMPPPPVVMVPAPPMTMPQSQQPAEVEFYYGTPKADPGDDPANWSARRNVIESNRYEHLVHTNPAFLQSRIRKECPFDDQEAFAQCVASFNQ